jgi:putative metallohydrolase (TIGR04338 family)
MSPPPPTDTQRIRLYAAEDLVARLLDRSTDHPVVEVAGSHLTLPAERRFGDIAAVQRYVDAVLDLDWVRRRWPRAELPMRVRQRRGARRAHYQWLGFVLAVPAPEDGGRWALRELVILHEIAHHLGPIDDPTHGPAFAGRLLDLVEEIIGPEVALLLRVSFADEGVSVG